MASAAAIVRAVDADRPPLRLLLGSGAYQLASSHLDAMRENIEPWKDLTVSADFPQE
ncbi:hypothetical protein [Sphingomonas sp. dw_22]|uniref:hypothetical protein n=1 Tax=Sphingomonas sp. dw_22 TaxID=2721175 RepID=UPI001BD65B63|nr:hypothetical protein [Sphingomonas sp. dw_22]